MRTAIVNGTLLDTVAMTMVGQRHLVIEDDRIVDIVEGRPPRGAERVLDARRRYVLPGLIDAHVHLTITTMDFVRGRAESPTERALGAARAAEATLVRGFTTVRDTGGDTAGLVRAIERGLCRGPRVVRAGRVLSQTGGHGDLRPRATDEPGCGCRIVSDSFAHVADGTDAVRKAARHELRGGADFLKVMASGGVASPSDPLESVQYTAEEIRAATIESDHRGTYTTAHAYTPEAVRQAVDHGVRCIEHANLVDDATARHLAALGVTVVPTLVTYRAMADLGAKAGLPQRNLDKNRGVFEAGLASIARLRAAGVELGLGTDLLGEAQPEQNRELAIRAELEAPVDLLRSLWTVNARLCRLEGRIGVLAPEAFADVVVCDCDPLEKPVALAEPEAHLSTIVARGRVVRHVA